MQPTKKLFAVTTSSTFTFRELRSFRALYTSQTFGVASKTKVNSVHYTYTFYGNAEAISPAQRRRFRESQNTFPFFMNTNASEKKGRKLQLFSTKRTKQIYAFSHFQAIRTLLYGNTLSRQFSIESNWADAFAQSSLKGIKGIIKSISFSQAGNFSEMRLTRPSFESFFKFFTNYRQAQIHITKSIKSNYCEKLGGADTMQALSVARLNKRKSESFFINYMQTADIAGIHLQFLESLFLFNDTLVNLQRLLDSPEVRKIN